MDAGLRSEELTGGDGRDTQIRRVRVGDSHVLVARLLSGEVVAFGPSCPHQFTELDEATIQDGNLRCPRHGYSFDPCTGENVHPRRDAAPENLWKLHPGYLECFAVREEDGWIWVSDEAKPPPASYDPALEQRPARPETPEAEEEAPVTLEQSLKFLNATSGTTLEVRLPFLPRTGFTWRFDVVGDLLQVLDEEFEPGYSPCLVLRVGALGVGAGTLSCTYARENGPVAEIHTFIVRIQTG